MAAVQRLRKHLSGPQPAPLWPAGIRLAPAADVAPAALHSILHTAYANGFGSVPPIEEWWPSLVSDTEYDAELLFVAADMDGKPVGLALCWTSGFVKDIAVSPAWRGRGIGEALLRAAFASFEQRGLPHVDLKVMAGNSPAIGLYRRMGMVDADL